MNAYMSNYQTNQIATATPEQILIMLYDGAIRFVSQADKAISEKKQEEKAKYINKTIAILSELSGTLDHEIGGEISTNLASLYDFMIRELNKANMRNDHNSLDIVKRTLSDLRETWKQAIEINHKEKTTAKPADANTAGHAATNFTTVNLQSA